MKRLDKLCSIWMGRHLESVRHQKGLNAAEVARRLGMAHTASYRPYELGRCAITLSFLLGVQLALNIPIQDLWFPFIEAGTSPEAAILEVAVGERLQRMSPVTVEEVLEATAEAFQVPLGAVTSGLGHKQVNRVRAAAALVVESIPHLRLARLARIVRRDTRSLLWSRRQAQKKESKAFWAKVAAIREEVESL